MTILVALDTSPYAARAVKHAAALSDASGEPLQLLRVLDPRRDLPDGPDAVAEVVASFRAARESEMEELLYDAGAPGDVRAEILGANERIDEAIVRVAGECDATVIAMGSHGAGLFRQSVMGSVAMGVVARSPLPVFVAGPRADETPQWELPYTILMADDLSAARHQLAAGLQRLAAGAKVHVHLLYLYEARLGDRGEKTELEAGRTALKALAERYFDMSRVTLDSRPLGEFERIDGGVLRVAKETGADAIAMATHGHSTRRRLLGGSKAVGVLKHARIPIVLVRSE